MPLPTTNNTPAVSVVAQAGFIGNVGQCEFAFVNVTIVVFIVVAVQAVAQFSLGDPAVIVNVQRFE